jgi:putative lipoic acid-binding regulatory protein
MTDKQTNNEEQEETLIDFPCDFPVKVMGASIPEFHACINKIAKKHDSEYITDETTQNVSKTGKYVSLTLNIHAKDKKQLDKIYQELTDHELVLWAL